ncbi:MAG: hypothetical protein ACRD29_11220 [Acidimicrobiales bacterium]
MVLVEPGGHERVNVRSGPMTSGDEEGGGEPGQGRQPRVRDRGVGDLGGYAGAASAIIEWTAMQ